MKKFIKMVSFVLVLTVANVLTFSSNIYADVKNDSKVYKQEYKKCCEINIRFNKSGKTSTNKVYLPKDVPEFGCFLADIKKIDITKNVYFFTYIPFPTLIYEIGIIINSDTEEVENILFLAETVPEGSKASTRFWLIEKIGNNEYRCKENSSTEG